MPRLPGARSGSGQDCSHPQSQVLVIAIWLDNRNGWPDRGKCRCIMHSICAVRDGPQQQKQEQKQKQASCERGVFFFDCSLISVAGDTSNAIIPINPPTGSVSQGLKSVDESESSQGTGQLKTLSCQCCYTINLHSGSMECQSQQARALLSPPFLSGCTS